MANNCLHKKYKSQVANDKLLKFGEFSFEVKNLSEDSSTFLQLYYNPNKVISAEARIVGDGYFTNSDKSQNLGKTKQISSGTMNIYLSKGNYTVIIPDKYDIQQITVPSGTGNNFDICLNVEDFKWSAISGEQFDFRYSSLFGNINAITGINVSYCNFAKTKITGDVGKFLSENDISVIFTVEGTSGLYGDISLCKNGLKKFGDSYDITHGNAFTWETERDNSYKIIAFCSSENKPTYFGGHVDAMLINQAKCQVGFDAGDSASYKTIRVDGVRSSASDSAVATLKTKGYTVIVNGETL